MLSNVEISQEFPSVPSFVWACALLQQVEALCYKPGGRRFDSQWNHRDFSLI